MIRRTSTKLRKRQLKKMIYAVEKLSKQYDYLYDLCFPMGDYINTGKPVKQTLA